MKNIVVGLIIVGLLGACSNDLDLEPRNGLQESVAFENFDGFQSYMAKIYASLTLTGQEGPAGNADLTIINDEGFSSYLRVYWKAQELTTDEAVIAWTDSGIRDLHNHNWGSDNQFIRVLYYRIFYTISLVNDFLRITDQYGGNVTTAENQAELELYKNEARFIRALAYWHALDMFRNVPLITTISSDLPNQVNPQVIFDFIESELDAVEPNLVENMSSAENYGRANRGAVKMLKAKLYLNAEVYTGENRYTDCIAEIEELISGSNYSIHNNFQELFMADNHLRTNEIIWSIVHDGIVSQTWGGTTTIIRGGIGGAMQDDEKNGLPYPNEAVTDYGVLSGWGGWRTTSSLVEKYPGAATSADASSPDGRAIFFNEGQSLEIEDVGIYEDGYAAPKFSNIESTTGQRAPGVDQVGTDFPVFRLADAYLMLAEAELRANGSIGGSTLGYLNELRERAYGNTSGNVTPSEVTLDWILDERARELFVEATRRTDLIRFGRFSGSNYLWPWKGNVAEGQATPDRVNIFPIPASELIANPNMKQNPGY